LVGGLPAPLERNVGLNAITQNGLILELNSTQSLGTGSLIPK